MRGVKAYFKGRSPGWWFSNGLLVAILLILLVPGWRTSFQAGFNRLFLRAPSTESTLSEPLSEESLHWTPLPLDQSEDVAQPIGTDEVVFINIWATWCPPCVSEMPSIEALAKRFNGKVRFLLVSPENPEKVRSFVTDKGYDLSHFYTSEYLPRQFMTDAYPTTIIISQARILDHLSGSYDWDTEEAHDKLDQLLRVAPTP